MALDPGTRLGPYEVLAPLGRGGMGEVYRARDTRLGREVAIKTLPPSFVDDGERRTRFEREARLLAGLNHPQIAAVYGLEVVEGRPYLVLELVPGTTLASRLARGPLPPMAAIDICRQIADALEVAHEAGIIHRDLKPGNVMLTPPGGVKVLDFGLAKRDASRPDPDNPSASSAPTATMTGTEAGVVLGTPGYMSPEQAMGDPVDRRTDIWSFGCVLFECLTGTAAFPGKSSAEILGGVLHAEPKWTALPADTPAGVRALVARCLRKDRRTRLRDIGDARLELEAPPATPDSIAAPVTRRRAWVFVPVLALCVAAAFAAGRWLRGDVNGEPSWEGERLLGGSTIAFGPAISPDGQTLAFEIISETTTQVAVMKPGSGGWTLLTRDRSHGPVLAIVWSRDSSRLYFDRGGSGIYSVPALGGDERLVLERADIAAAFPNGDLLVVRASDGLDQLLRYHTTAGTMEAIGPRFRSYGPITRKAAASPDGAHAIFFGIRDDAAVRDPVPALHLIDLTSGATRTLVSAERFRLALLVPSLPATFSADSRRVLVAVTAGDLQRIIEVPIDPGERERAVMALTAIPWTLDMAHDGTLYLDQCDMSDVVLRFSTGGGVPERIVRSIGAFNVARSVLQFPDGRVLLSSFVSGQSRLLVASAREAPRRFVDTADDTSGPTTMVGRDRVAFFIGSPAHQEIAIATIDGRVMKRIPTPAAVLKDLSSSPDGRTLYYVNAGVAWAMPTEGGAPRRLHDGQAVTVNPRTGDLIIRESQRIYGLAAAGGDAREVSYRHGVPLAPTQLGANAVRSDGLLALTLAPDDTWFWGPGILDPRAGTLTRVPLQFDGDVYQVGWANDGALLAGATEYRANLWRFHPAPRGR